jgi:hypothetical protein
MRDPADTIQSGPDNPCPIADEAGPEDSHTLLARMAAQAPEAIEEVLEDLFSALEKIRFSDLAVMAEDVLWAASREDSFAKEVARGYAAFLTDSTPSKNLLAYRRMLREVGSRGPETGRILARHLVPVVRNGRDGSLRKFMSTVEVLLRKGAYLLYSPLEVLSDMFLHGDVESGDAFMDLIHTVFDRDISYNRSRHWCHVLSVSAKSMRPETRAVLLRALRHVASADVCLMDPFLEGLEKGLDRLRESALTDFVSQGLDRYRRSRISGERFLSLESRTAREKWDGLQTGVALAQIGGQLSRYLRARIGFPVAVRSAAGIADSTEFSLPEVWSDGEALYLPPEISRFPNTNANREHYQCLVRLEAGVLEFGSYEFDVEKALGRIPGGLSAGHIGLDPSVSDLDRFFSLFPSPSLASDFFSLLDQGRIRILCQSRYPGLLRKLVPLMEKELDHSINKPQSPEDLPRELIRRISLGLPVRPELPDQPAGWVEHIASVWEAEFHRDPSVETVAVAVSAIYPAAREWLGDGEISCFPFPWGMRLIPGPAHAVSRKSHRIAEKIRASLARQGIHLYRSEVQKKILRSGRVDRDAVRNLIRSADMDPGSGQDASDGSEFQEPEAARVSWYPEWDANLQDYVYHHVRVIDRDVPEKDSEFYRQMLIRHAGRIAEIRRAFEILHPQGITRLRPWADGDEFDYPAMLDYAADRKRKCMPSDRLYIKRIKQERSVSVLLLVDLSRSTAHPAAGKDGDRKTESVLGVEKEAIVLFVEALEAIGDDYAVAGFSGTGRLSVDYFRIKDFQESAEHRVRGRIGALNPRRNTRMGAAVRHGTRELGGTRSAVKLMIVLGDGFPNDTDYKQGYAIADTRQAILEAFSRHIHVRAITVNMAADPRLDELYGARHHHVISDVSELPERLVRMYRTLTRM